MDRNQGSTESPPPALHGSEDGITLLREPRSLAAVFRFRPLALFGEKALEQRAAFGLPHAARDFAPMVEGGELQEVQNPAGAATLRVARSENDTRQPDVNDRAGAHRTRFLRDVERAVGEPPVAHDLF